MDYEIAQVKFSVQATESSKPGAEELDVLKNDVNLSTTLLQGYPKLNFVSRGKYCAIISRKTASSLSPFQGMHQTLTTSSPT